VHCESRVAVAVARGSETQEVERPSLETGTRM
jgi:hypothetical protein